MIVPTDLINIIDKYRDFIERCEYRDLGCRLYKNQEFETSAHYLEICQFPEVLPKLVGCYYILQWNVALYHALEQCVDYDLGIKYSIYLLVHEIRHNIRPLTINKRLQDEKYHITEFIRGVRWQQQQAVVEFSYVLDSLGLLDNYLTSELLKIRKKFPPADQYLI